MPLIIKIATTIAAARRRRYYVVVVAEPNCGPLKVCIRVYRRYRITDKKRHRSG